MAIPVLLLADRPGGELRPLTDRTCAALLPVAAKPVLEHAIESLVAAGVTDGLLLASPHFDQVRAFFGGGARWGIPLELVAVRASDSLASHLDRASHRLGTPFLVLRGDLLRADAVRTFLDLAERVPGPCVSGRIGGRPAGLWLVRDPAGAASLPADPGRAGRWLDDAPAVDLPVRGLSLLDSLAAFHAANLDAAAGRYDGLRLPGRTTAPGVRLGRQTVVASGTIQGTPVLVGARCSVKSGAEILGDVVLADDVVVDRRATLRRAVVLPDTYVGELVEVSDAIVWRDELIRVDSGTVHRVTDSFLLSDLSANPIPVRLGRWAQRALGALILLVTLPLWPVMVLASLAAAPGHPFRHRVLCGNRSLPGPDGRPRRATFVTLEPATPVPILRYLPRLLAVVRGDLRIVGVTPLGEDQLASPREDWERVRDLVPAGLVGPAQLDVPEDAPDDERRVVEAYYASTRTLRSDVRLLGRAMRAVFTARAWGLRRRPRLQPA